LRITEEYALDRNRTTELASENISTALALVVHSKIRQAIMLKSMVLDPG